MDDWYFVTKDEKTIKKEREKARKLKESQWWKQKKANGLCFYCGQAVPPKEITMDHKLPVARGGKSTKGNCVPSCRACNQKKSLLTPAEMLFLPDEAAAKGSSPEES